MATSNAAATVADPVASVEEASTAKNADFASQLHDELMQVDDEASLALESEKTNIGNPAGKLDRKNAVSVADKQIAADRVLDLLRSGDLGALAKELGQDPKDFRVKNSQFIRLRQTEAKTRKALAQERQQVNHERETIAQQRANLQQTQAAIFKAVKHIEDEDWIGFLETATGRSFDEIQKQLVQNSLDPSAKEVRKLRAEQERLQRERDEENARRQHEHRTVQEQQARAQYMGQLKAELLEDEDFAEFSDHPNMPRFLDAVFTEQQKAFDGEETISVRRAAQRAIKVLVSEASSWSPFVTKFSGSVETAPKGKTNEQSARPAQGARTKSVARGQGGAPPNIRDMSAQERIAFFGAQMRAENSGR